MTMLLGTLSLFQKRGIFYKEQQLHTTDGFSSLIDQELKSEEVFIASDIPNRHQMTPVEASGSTDYITGIFEDDGNASYPYEITVWLLVEETPEVYEDKDDVIPARQGS